MPEEPHESTRRLKADLRRAARARRQGIPTEQREHDAERLADALLRLPEIGRARLVLGYGANAEEIDPGPALERMRGQGVRVAYPRVAGSQLDLHEVSDPADLVTGSFGISEPRPTAPRIAPADIDTVLVPGIAFDREGYRIGYGGGFYDRLLEQLSASALKIGVAFDEQLLEAVPREAHDRPVDVIVTPSQVLRIASGEV